MISVMGISYKYHKNYTQSILIRNFDGKISVDDIIGSWEFLIDNGMIPGQLEGIISDLTNCDLNMDLNDFYKLINYLRNNAQLRKLKQAVVSQNPQTIVFPTLGEQNEHDCKIRPFSTEQAAVNWIINV